MKQTASFCQLNTEHTKVTNMKTTYTTQKQVRALFWEQHPELAPHYRSAKRQNQYGATIRSAFVEFVDHLQRSGDITDKLANRVTL